MEDFKKVENVDRLRVIIMDHMDYYPLTPFKSLRPKEQKRFNEKLNGYIKELPEDERDWNAKMQEDFNEVCVREIFTEDFDPSKIPVYTGVYKDLEEGATEEAKKEQERYEEEKRATEVLWEREQQFYKEQYGNKDKLKEELLDE
jgi:hypothetical protein